MKSSMKNLLVRTCTGAAFVALVVASILLGGTVLLNVFLIFACIGIYEYVKLLDTKGVNISIWFYVVSVFCYFWPAYMHMAQLWTAGILLVTVAAISTLMLLELFRKQYSPIETAAYSVMGVMWIVIPMSLINVMAADYGNWTLLAMFILIWLSDTFAYCVGSLIGKHKLCERISPGKTWEGSIGSAILTVGAAWALPYIMPQYVLTGWQSAGMALIIMVFGTMGDLLESLLKRSLNVKDSGNILPGHGGMLDRFDSTLIAVPFVMMYLMIVLK